MMDSMTPPSGDMHFPGAIDPVEEERSRLEADIADAKARLLAAQHAAAQLDAQTKQAIRAELAESREDLAELDRRHAESVRRVRDEAAVEVERILSAARATAAGIDGRLDPTDDQVSA
jgi:hypothetical protein